MLAGLLCCTCASLVASSHLEVLGNPECHRRYEKPVDDLVKEINNDGKLDDESDLGVVWGQAVALVERDGMKVTRVVTLFDLVDKVSLDVRLRLCVAVTEDG